MIATTVERLTSDVIRLPDGRRLGVHELGDPRGHPVFFFHGLGASRLCVHPDDRIPLELGVRVIALDRPGIGLSDKSPGRTVLDRAADVVALADAMHLDRFACVGWSGGGAHALACAHAVPARVTAVALVSARAPLDGEGAASCLTPEWTRIERMARIAPWLMRAFFATQCRAIRRAPRRFVDRLVAGLGPPDREILGDPAMRDMLDAMIGELVRQGSRGLFDDGLALARPWGFSPADVRVTVHLWHGLRDTVIPPSFGRYLARLIPGCQARFPRTDGHMLYLGRWGEILETVTRAAPAAH
jgi:pimeloyl-ACP methyl ester carboxylesterase